MISLEQKYNEHGPTSFFFSPNANKKIFSNKDQYQSATNPEVYNSDLSGRDIDATVANLLRRNQPLCGEA